MLRLARVSLQKKPSIAAALGAAGGTLKAGADDKWGQVAMEYLYERVQCHDMKKTRSEVENERAISYAHDRLATVSEHNFEVRMSRLVERMNEAMEAVPAELLEEACLLNSQQPPLNLRRPSLTPPLLGYEPGFGFDVPQLRGAQHENPPLKRDTDRLQYGDAAYPQFPFLEAGVMEEFTTKVTSELDACHGEVRQAVPTTGTEGEAWEAFVALNRKALARQKLLLDLANDPELAEQYSSDDAFAAEVRQRRGLLPLDIEAPIEFAEPNSAKRAVPPTPAELHWAQQPHNLPFRD